MPTRSINITNPENFEPEALAAAVLRAQQMLTGELPEHWASTSIGIHTNGRDRDGMLEVMLHQVARVRDCTQPGGYTTGTVIAIGMIQRPGSTEFEFHS